MLLLDFRSTTVPQPVPDFLNQSERAVPEKQEENLEAVAVGGAYPPHEHAVSSMGIFAVGPANAEKNELYAVRVEGSPEAPVNKAFVTTATKLLSFDPDAEAYPREDQLDYDRSAGPPRPAVVRALTAELTRDNGSGKPLPFILAL
jgi:hypothetical protein